MAQSQIDTDAFADSQIQSKLWLCERLERLVGLQPFRIAVYGGWYGIASLLLLSRQKAQIEWIRSYDIDPAATAVANLLLNRWEMEKWKFRAITGDVNWIIPDTEPVPNLIINTSTEHMTMPWWDMIPRNTVVAIQGTNQIAPDHHNPCDSLEVFKARYGMNLILYEGVHRFDYPDRSFKRFMLIGHK